MTHSRQSEIVQALGSRADVDAAAEIERRVGFLVNYLGRSGASGFVLGISGGQDSSLAGRLAQLAAERVRAEGGQATFVAARLPYGVQRDEADARLALGFIGADREVAVDIKDGVDAVEASVAAAVGDVADYHKGNIKAQVRMVAQYAIGGQLGLLVIGTDHAAEAVTGFFTKFGDGGADVLPLAGLTKSQGAALLRHLEAPARLWEKQPTADLLDANPGRLDTDELGLDYSDIDAFLRGEPVAADVTTAIVDRYDRTEHKRRGPVTPDDTWWR
jgi:NAD+ synthase